MKRVAILGMGLCLLGFPGGLPTAGVAEQVLVPQDQPAIAPQPAAPAGIELNAPAAAPAGGAADGDKPVKALTDGPVHEAFLSPAKDLAPEHVEKPPPPPIVERPGVDPPSLRSEWIGGYWDWDAGRNDFVWVTGTWRNPPPGRFWVNGYWKRDDQGWYRVPGFWSDRKTDRIDYRKNGPPADHPDDTPGESPGADFYYVPGQYYPDGDGVVWKPGFWAKVQPGWAWVPAVDPSGRRLGLPGRVLGPHTGRPRDALRARAGRAGGPKCRHRVSALQPDLTPELWPALRRLWPPECLL